MQAADVLILYHTHNQSPPMSFYIFWQGCVESLYTNILYNNYEIYTSAFFR